MNKDAIIGSIQHDLEGLLSPQPDHFLVEIKIKPTNNIKVYIDGDHGVGIDDLVRYNRALYKIMEENQLFPDGDFSLELSSPGLGEPLKLLRQYQKNIGRFVEVTLQDGEKIDGKLLSADAAQVQVEQTLGKGKKAEIKQHTIAMDEIKTTQVQIKF